MEPLAVGDHVGRYELLRRLGAGGMGEVWEAVLHGPEGFRRTVALKLLVPLEDEPQNWQALVHEARLGAMLSHPNVVATHDLGRAGDRWYLAMELVRGPSLSAVRRVAPLPPLALVQAALQVCAGLDHIHGLVVDGRPAGLLHRDIKPANLLVDPNGLVKIADLGIARLARDSRAGSGTPGYMAPEQGEGEDRRADIFALGATLYVLATGRMPFGTGVPALYQAMQVEEKLAEGLCRPVEAAVPGLGPILHTCLRLDPEERWSDVAALARALSELRVEGPGLTDVLAQRFPELSHARSFTHAPERSSMRTLALVPGNLPRQRDPFFGRTEEIASLCDRARAGARLIVLKGMGGAGKTRLSLEVARELGPELPGGSWFVELATATDAAQVCAAVSAALQVPAGSKDLVHQLGRAIAYRGRALFVLDNVEQVVDALPATLGRWLDLAPEAIFVVSSRVTPRLLGEEVVEIGPLSVEAAVDLFVDRSPRPPAEGERALVARLVEELEYLPLAIELAAVRTRVMTVERIRRHLGDRLRLLSGGGRDRPDRQRSMAASLEASWELASPAARAALCQLAVFEGGFTLEAAEGVVSLDDDAPWMVDVLAELVDASVVRGEPRGGRFQLPAIVAEWAWGRAGTETIEAAQRRHGTWFAQWGSEAGTAQLTRASGRELDGALGDLDNLVAATRRALARGDASVAAATCNAAAGLLTMRGPIDLLIELSRAVLAMEGTVGVDRRRLLVVYAGALVDAGQIAASAEARAEAVALAEAQDHPTTVVAMLGMEARLQQRIGQSALALTICERALALAKRAGPDAEVGARLHLGQVLANAGRLRDAEVAFLQALEGARATGDRRRQAICHNNLGLVYLYLARLDAAAEHAQQALTLCEATADRRGELVARSNFGSIRFQSGRLEEARPAWVATSRILGEIGDDRGLSTTMLQLGELQFESGHLSESRERFRQALAIKQRTEDTFGEMQVRASWGSVEVEVGQLDTASDLLGPASRWGRKVGHDQLLVMVETSCAQIALARGDLAEAEARCEVASVSAAKLGPRDEGRVLTTRGRVALAGGRRDDAVADLERAVGSTEGADFVLWCEAAIALSAALGRTERAVALLREVASRCDGGGFTRLRDRALARLDAMDQSTTT
ncbi:MAG: protein kinase [Alphaproteobacteria bacterium]|nr:protein kinase [Alphaproteobacteria bacterium]